MTPKSHGGPAVSCRHSGHDGVRRARVRRDALRMTAFEPEAQPPILHEDPRAFRYYAAAEVLIDRVDETAGVSVAVDDRDRDRIAMRRERALSRRRQMAKRAHPQ